jgi:photosystem II stability/assembly factor-like uncharacterized protein
MSGGGSFVLRPNESKTVRVRFYPRRAMSLSATVQIQHDAATSLPVNIALPLRATAIGVWQAAAGGLPNTDILCLANTDTHIFAGTNGEGIFRSNDNGTTWQSVNTGFSSRITTAMTRLGNRIIAATFGGIIQSIDNGATWTLLNPGLGSSSNPIDLTNMITIDSVIVASTSRGLWRSLDGGRIWSAIQGVSSYRQTNNGVSIFAASGSLFVNGIPNIMRSDDYGVTWKEVSLGFTETFPRTQLVAEHLFGNSQYVFAISQGVMYRSSNKGENWERVIVDVDNLAARYGSFNNGIFANAPVVFTANTSIFLCLTNVEERFRILRSDDNGTSWRDFGTGSISSGASTSKYQACLILNNSAFFGLRFDNSFPINQPSPARLLRASLNSAVTSVTEIYEVVRKSLMRYFIAPNPSEGLANLHYTLTTPNRVEIQVFGILGNHIATLVQEQQAAGNYVVPVDVRTYPSGQYYVRLSVNGEWVSRSLQVVR